MGEMRIEWTRVGPERIELPPVPMRLNGYGAQNSVYAKTAPASNSLAMDSKCWMQAFLNRSASRCSIEAEFTHPLLKPPAPYPSRANSTSRAS